MKWPQSARLRWLAFVRSKPPRWLPEICTAFPAILLLVQIAQNWVNIPYWDEWDLIATLRISLQDGSLRPLDLFTQHSDSRFVLPQLLLLPLARLTHWDLRFEMVVTFATVCLISWVLWRLLGEIDHLPRWAIVFCLLVSNCLLFSPIQYETWLWGINLSLVLPPLLLLLSLRVNLSGRPLPTKVGLTSLLCFGSTFSNANGMGNWLLAFPGFAKTGKRSARKWLWYGAYVVAAGGSLLLYLWGYQSHLGFATAFQSPSLLAAYFFSWLGAPLALALGPSAWIAGLCLALVFILLVYANLRWEKANHGRKLTYPFAAIGCYAGLSGAATAIGRVGLPFEWALSSRYTTSSLYLPIAVVGLTALLYSRGGIETDLGRKRIRQIVFGLIVITILGSSLATYHRGIQGMNWTRKTRARGRAALLFSEILPHNADLKILSSQPDLMIKRYHDLLHCSMARDHFVSLDSIPQLKPRVEIDRSHGCLEICQLKGGRLELKGWALRSGKKPASFVLFAYRSDGTTAIPFAVAPTGNTNPKLAGRGLRNCGFEIDVDQLVIKAGRVEISAWAVNPEQGEVAQLATLYDIHIPQGVEQ